jgi:hypothetical protein
MPVAQIAPAIGEALSTALQIEKLSILGVIALWAILATLAAWKLNKKLALVYRQRDRARDYQLIYKAALDHAGIKVDTAAIEQQYKEDLADEAAG